MSKGFTLIELLVVTAIVALMSAVMFPNYRAGDQQLALKRATAKLAQDLRRAEEMAVSAKEFQGQTPESYIVSFAYRTDPTKYFIWANISGVQEIVEEISLDKAVEIYNITPSVDWAGSSGYLKIEFVAPNPTVGFFPNADSALITLALKGNPSSQKSVRVNKAGLISIE